MIRVGQTEDGEGEDAEINLTPLIDVVFMLIVFLLLTASAAQYVITVDTPDVDSAVATASIGLVLYPPEHPNDPWVFNSQPFDETEEVVAAITQAIEQDSERVLVIGVGAEVNAQRLVDAMNIARRAGAKSVDIAVDERPG